MDAKLVEDKDKPGTGEVLRLGQQTKSRLNQRQTSHMVLVAAEHWLVGSDKYRLQHSQMNIVACSCQYGAKGREVVSLRQCEQALRVCFQGSGYSWIRLVEYQWVFRSRIVITRAIYRFLPASALQPEGPCEMFGAVLVLILFVVLVLALPLSQFCLYNRPILCPL